jgi:Ca2+-binding EF-hand superfamily protein
LTRIKSNYDKNPINTTYDRRKLIGFLNCGKNETDIIFEYFDMDENGVIDSYEFICAIAMLCHSSVELRCEFLFKLYDLDNDSYLSVDEIGNLIRNYLISQKKPAFIEEISRQSEEFLSNADLDLDNKLSLKEFQVILY